MVGPPGFEPGTFLPHRGNQGPSLASGYRYYYPSRLDYGPSATNTTLFFLFV